MRVKDCKNSDLYRGKNFLSETSKLRKTVHQREDSFIISPVTAIPLRKLGKKEKRKEIFSTFVTIYFSTNNKLHIKLASLLCSFTIEILLLAHKVYAITDSFDTATLEDESEQKL